MVLNWYKKCIQPRSCNISTYQKSFRVKCDFHFVSNSTHLIPPINIARTYKYIFIYILKTSTWLDRLPLYISNFALRRAPLWLHLFAGSHNWAVACNRSIRQHNPDKREIPSRIEQSTENIYYVRSSNRYRNFCIYTSVYSTQIYPQIHEYIHIHIHKYLYICIVIY